MKTLTQSDNIQNYYDMFPLTDLFSSDPGSFTDIVIFDDGEYIMKEGSICSDLYYMVKGRARLFLSHENGRISLINFLEAPCFIGEMELLNARKCTNGVSAVAPCICYKISIERCRDMLLGDVKFLRGLCIFLSRKAVQNTWTYSENQSFPLEKRLAAFIIMTARRGCYREKHTETAEFLGVSYRHLLYVLAGFIKKGILVRSETGYLIKDLNMLRTLAGNTSD